MFELFKTKSNYVFIFSLAILVSLLASNCGDSDSDSTGITYAIGGTGPAGGLIFYIDEANTFEWTYLEAAPASSEGSEVWSNIADSAIGSAAQGTAIGTGKTNTDAIIAQASHLSSAAKICADLDINGYSDWFLPSKDELHAIRNNLFLNDIGDFGNGPYWSSTEYDSDEAWLEEFSHSYENQTQYAKDVSQTLRAIRAF